MLNNTRNMPHLIEDCKNFMVSNGLPLSVELHTDGSIQRYSSDKRNQKDEWYIAHEVTTYFGTPYLVCTFGSWRKSLKLKFISYNTNSISSQERQEIIQAIKEKEHAQEAQLKKMHIMMQPVRHNTYGTLCLNLDHQHQL